MCGVVGALICIYCRSGCSGSTVASALAFQPPEPFYELDYDETTKKCDIRFTSELETLLTNVHMIDNISATIVKANSSMIPICCIRSPDAEFTIVYSHGNATDIGAMIMVYAMMAKKLNVNIVAYDYTGYGPHWLRKRNGVRPTEKQTYKDIECVYKWCIETKLVQDPTKEIILYGQSVGSGPSCYLASVSPVAGIVLHSPILSGLRVLTNSRLLFTCDIFPNIDRIKKVCCPVFIIHGEEDAEVRLRHGMELHGAVQEKYRYPEPWWVPDKGHNDVLAGNEKEFFIRMSQFLEYAHDFSNKEVSGIINIRVENNSVQS